MPVHVPEQIQIEALLGKDAPSLRSKYAADIPSREAYPLIFTVSPNRILEYAKANYELSDLFYAKPGQQDGIYVIRKGSQFKIYDQERGIRMGETSAEDEDQAWRRALRMHLESSGTGYILRADQQSGGRVLDG